MEKTYSALILVLLLVGTSACSPSGRDTPPPSGRESLTPMFPAEADAAGTGGAGSPAEPGAAGPSDGGSPTTATGTGGPTASRAKGAGGGSSAATSSVADGADAGAAANEPGVAPANPVQETGSAGGEGARVPSGEAPGPPSAPNAPTGAGPTPAPGVSSFADPRGDLTPSPLDPPPPYADLTGGRLSRSGTGFELRVRTGGPVAARGPADRTMNIASFFDVDGDGVIDYELWANLADNGWSPAYFDNVGGGAKFGQASGVAIEVVGDELVLRFPLAHLSDPPAFRWSLASEWGRYEVISTPAAASDDAPDNDGFARFIR